MQGKLSPPLFFLEKKYKLCIFCRLAMIHTFVCTNAIETIFSLFTKNLYSSCKKLLLIGTVYHHWFLFLRESTGLTARLLLLHQRSSSQAAKDLILLLPKSLLKLFVVKQFVKLPRRSRTRPGLPGVMRLFHLRIYLLSL